MENTKTLIFFTILIIFTHSDIQTGNYSWYLGYIDVNQQLGNMETVNSDSNTLCYTEIFSREFLSQPKIATSLA